MGGGGLIGANKPLWSEAFGHFPEDFCPQEGSNIVSLSFVVILLPIWVWRFSKPLLDLHLFILILYFFYKKTKTTISCTCRLSMLFVPSETLTKDPHRYWGEHVIRFFFYSFFKFI